MSLISYKKYNLSAIHITASDHYDSMNVVIISPSISIVFELTVILSPTCFSLYTAVSFLFTVLNRITPCMSMSLSLSFYRYHMETFSMLSIGLPSAYEICFMSSSMLS